MLFFSNSTRISKTASRVSLFSNVLKLSRSNPFRFAEEVSKNTTSPTIVADCTGKAFKRFLLSSSPVETSLTFEKKRPTTNFIRKNNMTTNKAEDIRRGADTNKENIMNEGSKNKEHSPSLSSNSKAESERLTSSSPPSPPPPEYPKKPTLPPPSEEDKNEKHSADSLLSRTFKFLQKNPWILSLPIPVVLLFLYAYYKEMQNRKAPQEAVMKGYCPAPLVNDVIERPDVEKALREILNPKIGKFDPFYYLISGEHGTGKTTIVRKICREIGNGIIYIDVPKVPGAIVLELAHALNYDMEEITVRKLFRQYLWRNPSEAPEINLENEESVYKTLKKLMRLLEGAARIYKEKTNKPMVFVIDDCNRFAKKYEEGFGRMQDWAKDMADARLIRLVFVSSEGIAPRILLSRSSSSRMHKPFFEIGDLSDEDSIRYLEKQGIPLELAKPIVSEIIGGRFIELRTAVSLFEQMTPEEMKSKKGSILQEFKKMQMTIVGGYFQEAGLLSETPERMYGLKVIKALLASPNNQIDKSEYDSLVNDFNIHRKLLSSQLFAYHPYNGTVTFQSRSVYAYAKENFGKTS